jgi:hypothetical protein
MDAKNHDGLPTFVPGTTIGIRHISAAQLEIFEVDTPYVPFPKHGKALMSCSEFQSGRGPIGADQVQAKSILF